MEQVYIGFGSNQGDSVRICREAVEALRRHPEIEVVRVSSLYRTEPVGMIEQDWFINGVVSCKTSLKPLDLLDVTSRIEEDLGRVRAVRWGPRSLDLDILSFGELQVDLPQLTIPHPRLHERLFVLIPLEEIAPDWLHPVFRLTARELLVGLPAASRASAVHLLEGV
jgi:2-amino-4-hydroxy-6-hydroxymethyldihydropteridine diphosphokinase